MHQWHYESNGKATGPVSETELLRLRGSGTVQDSTQIWREGLKQWTPFREVFGAASQPAEPEIPQCSGCGKTVAASDLVSILGVLVCADCKPLTLQGVREGLAPVASFPSITTWRDGRYYVVRHGESELPRRCIKCNGTHGLVPQVRKASLLLSGGMALGSLCRSIRVVAYMCKDHDRKRREANWWTAGSLLVIGLLLWAMAFSMPWIIKMCLIVIPVGISVQKSQHMEFAGVRKVRKNGVWLSGAGKPFLESLPEWTD